MQINNEREFLLEEILGEGSLFICFSVLNRNYGWDVDKYKDRLKTLEDAGVFDLEFDDGQENRKVTVDEVDFDDPEFLKKVNFLPNDAVWAEIRDANNERTKPR